MSLLDETQYLERRKFFNSERLLDTDLNDQEEFHRQMRWLHNRSLHQPGVGNGYKVTGRKGDREVVVNPGYALDAYGREIVLVQGMTFPVPPVASDKDQRPIRYFLTVSYPDDGALSETELRQGICNRRGAVRLAERPNLCWVQLQVNPEGTAYTATTASIQKDIDDGRRIVLAMIEVFQCRINSDISLASRLDARPPRLPYTASGIEPQPSWGLNPIKGLSIPSDPNKDRFPVVWPAPFSLRATVNLAEGLFAAIPRYLVRIASDRVMPLPKIPQTVFLEPVIDLQLKDSLTNHLQFTIWVTLLVWFPDRDTWDVAKPIVFPQNGDSSKLAEQAKFKDRWSIVWVGIEG